MTNDLGSPTTQRQSATTPSPRARQAATPRGRIVRFGSTRLVIHPRTVFVTALITVLAIILAMISMSVGSMKIPLAQIFSTLALGHDSGTNSHVVMNLRLPRVLTALGAGAALGASGAVFQSVSRNALGSPDLIGFTTGAATAVVIQIVLFGGTAIQVALSAVVGGVLTAALVYVLSMKGGVTGGYRLILIGIGVGAMLGALNTLLLVKGDLDNAVTANIWLAGSLDARKWSHALPLLVGVLILIPLLALLGRRATIMEMGDDMAQQLGISTERTRLALIFGAVLLAALATGAAGPIAFVALAAPQLVLRLSNSNTAPIVSGALMGALLLVAADMIVQVLPTAATIPVGKMTGVIGGIYLIWLLTRSRQV